MRHALVQLEYKRQATVSSCIPGLASHVSVFVHDQLVEVVGPRHDFASAQPGSPAVSGALILEECLHRHIVEVLFRRSHCASCILVRGHYQTR